eukprot:TRINITY_DN6153_c0_g1_i1.p1 TRINITY_DN6153_c0_g1~~TRINITY_DN6153_c0_g1_i1.p1  ORF type:complete len:621 (+),score=158.27 TRINITY_DN6153_c0_g1_i1:83-1864(+)
MRAAVLGALLLGAPPAAPTPTPSSGPTAGPSAAPTGSPRAPSQGPTAAPTAPTAAPTTAPSAPTAAPTMAPSAPSASPSGAPTAPSVSPTGAPTAAPTALQPPSGAPTAAPTASPTAGPTAPTRAPTAAGALPTGSPSPAPSAPPSAAPSAPSASPTGSPSRAPAPATAGPSSAPTAAPAAPSGSPSQFPTGPSASPSQSPTGSPGTGVQSVATTLVLNLTMPQFDGVYRAALINSIRAALQLATGVAVLLSNWREGSVLVDAVFTAPAGQQATVDQAQAALVGQANDPNSALRGLVPALTSGSTATPPPSSSDGGLSAGAIAAIIICVLFAVAVIAVLAWRYWKTGGICPQKEVPKGAGGAGNPIEHAGSRAMLPVPSGRLDAADGAAATRRASATSGLPEAGRATQQAEASSRPQGAAASARGPVTRSSTAPQQPQWQVGQLVDANFQGQYYPATVTELVAPADERCPAQMRATGALIVTWAEDGSQTIVGPEEVRPCADPAVAAALAASTAGAPQGAPSPPASPGEGEYQVGQAVQVLWHGQWHPGTVCGRKGGGQYNIDWGDNTGSTGISAADIRPLGAGGGAAGAPAE